MKIRVPGVKRTAARSGVVYYYHRATGTRITEPAGTSAFLARVEQLDRQAAGAGPGTPVAPGTLGALITAYRGSTEFRGLAPRTRADYQRVLDYLAPLTTMPLRRRPVRGPRPNRARTAHGWRFANYVVQVLRLLFSWGVLNGHARTNAVRGTPRLARPRGLPRRNRAWTPAELAAVLAAAPGGVRVAVALGAYCGMRLGDALALRWSARADRGLGWAKTGDPVWLPEHRELTPILDTAPKDGVHVVTRRDGRPYPGNGFRSVFHRVVRRLQAAGTVGAGPGSPFTACASRPPRAWPTPVATSIPLRPSPGLRSAAMVRHYTRGADQRRRATAAIARSERAGNNVGKKRRTRLAKRPDDGS